MKKIIFITLFLSSLLFSLPVNGHSMANMENVVELTITGKTGNTTAFSIPDKYIADGSSLIVPMIIKINDGENQEIYELQTTDFSINIPISKTPTATWYVTVELGSYSETKKW